MILELKIDHTPDEAIAQIKDKKYALRFAPKIAGNREYTGRILGSWYFCSMKKVRECTCVSNRFLLQ